MRQKTAAFCHKEASTFLGLLVVHRYLKKTLLFTFIFSRSQWCTTIEIGLEQAPFVFIFYFLI
jgi:hypothetical protein